MRNFRRFAAIGLPVLVASTLVVGGPAAAQEPVVEQAEAFAGNATGRAFELTALGQGLTMGDTSAIADSTMAAKAAGIGVLNPVADGTKVEAAVGQAGAINDPAEACDGPDLSAFAELGLTAALACGNALASAVDALPVAEADAAVGDVTISASTLLATLGLQDTVNDTTNTVLATLDPLLNSFDETQIGDGIDTVKDLLADVINTDTLSVAIGDSTSKVVTTAGDVSSVGYSAGAVIEILPQGVLDETQPTNLDARRPVATIEVGAAEATASYTRGTVNSVAEVDPALVRVTLDRTVAAGLSLNDGTEDFVIEVAPGADETILAGTPLESRIVAASGNTYNLENGVGAQADAVRLELLKGLEGGVVLSLASAKAEITGVPELVAQVRSVPPESPVELPRTGGTPILPIAGVGLLGLAVALRRLATR